MPGCISPPVCIKTHPAVLHRDAIGLVDSPVGMIHPQTVQPGRELRFGSTAPVAVLDEAAPLGQSRCKLGA